MDESGIDLAFDLSEITDSFNLDAMEWNDAIGIESTLADYYPFYELKSKTVPESPPTFKTATPTSRTQLKLQLMREKWQEEERREAEKQAQHQSTSTSIKVPVNIHSFGIDVPPQVLQVRTELENPTRYHVMQKQKNQVRQFLCESGQQPLLAAQQVLGTARGQPSAVHSAPVSSAVSSAPVIPEQQPKQNVTSISSENILSPSLSSVATSASESKTIPIIDARFQFHCLE